MNHSFDSSAEMGRSNRETNPRDGIKSESKVAESENEEGPMDLSMPRYPNRTKDARVGNSYFAAGRKKSAPPSYDVDVNEQPIDYSKKYVESNPLSAAKTNYVPRNSLNKVKPVNREREKVAFSRQTGKADPYGDYAETDLDQPTDYSLRYAEDDTDDEEKQNDSYFTVNEQEDTIKTYCTEGTPYETPFNVSTATSMSDLRLEDGETSRRISRKIIPEKHTTPVYTEEDKEEEENNEETENEILTKESKNMSNELVLNSSNASIEKPMNYYDEGIPGRMARVSSLSSLGCANCPRNETEENNAETSKDQATVSLLDSPIASIESNEQTEDCENPLAPVDSINDSMNDEETAVSGPEEEKEERVVDKEGKVVTFGGEDHYAEQTPLMFSRSSSLGSLSGFEQQSIHDDRSSIVSDFSRITSGVVSPSELPDSPTQTVPPSPRHNNQKSNTNDLSPRAPMFRNYSYIKSPRAKSSIFEDNVAAFKEESTPLEFSAATSLSSLTIDDEPKIIMDKKEKDYPEKSDTREASLVDDSADAIDPEINDVNEEASRERVENDGKNREQMSDEDDEAIVMACISMGMRSTMYRQISTPNPDNSQEIVSRIPTIDSATNLVRYQTSSTLDRLVADVSVNSTNSQPPPQTSSTEKTENSAEPAATVVVPVDCVRIYCTEDTPAVSPTGSQSSLSALSMLSITDDIQNYERDQGSGQDEDNSSGEDARLVEECIRAGMKQALGASFSFPSTALSTKFHSPSHVRSTKKFEECLPVEGRQVSSTSSTSTPIHASSTKKNESDSLQEQSSMRKTDSCPLSQNSSTKKVDEHLSSRVSPTKKFEDYSQSHVSTTKRFESYGSSQESPTKKFETYDSSQASPTKKFETYGSSQASPTKKFETYGSSQSSPMKKFETYESSQSSPMKKFEGYESSQSSPMKKFETYGSSQSSPMKKFETYESSQSSPMKKFEGYESSQSSPMKKFETYGSSQSSPMKKFETYGSSQSSPMKKFETYGSSQESTSKKFETYGSNQPSPTKKIESYSSSHLSTLKKYDGNLPRSVENRGHVSTTHLPSQGNFTSKIDPCSLRQVTTTKKYEGQHSPRHVSSRKKVEVHSPSHGTKRYDGNLANQGSSTKRYEGPLPRPIDNRQASLMSPPSHVSSLKKYEGHLPRPVDSRHLSSISLPRSIDNRHVSSISLSSSASSMRKFEGRLPRPVDPRQGFSSRTTISSNDIPAYHAHPQRSHSAGADHDRTPNDDSSSHSDEDAILAQTIQSVMPKGTISTSSFLKVHATRKTPEISPRHAKLGDESLSSSRSMNTVIRITEAQITITGNDELLESAGNNSSLTEEEEALLLAQCIRSGMATALNMPKDSDYQRKQ